MKEEKLRSFSRIVGKELENRKRLFAELGAVLRIKLNTNKEDEVILGITRLKP